MQTLQSTLASKRPRFDAATENAKRTDADRSFFLPPPRIVERFRNWGHMNKSDQEFKVFPKSLALREAWVKWFKADDGYGFLHYYDEAKHQQNDLYFHAADGLQFSVEIGQGEDATKIFIDAAYRSKIEGVVHDGANARTVHITPVPQINPGTQCGFIYACDSKKGPYACRWFLVESYHAAKEQAETILSQIQKQYSHSPRFSLFIEDRSVEDVDKSWDIISPTSELWFETNQYTALATQWDALKTRLNWMYQRLVVILEIVHANGEVETEVSSNLDEIERWLQSE